jgi:signal recognition particle subunit SRP19
LKLKNAEILWTVYFDSTLSRSQGRRLALKYCVPRPRVDELAKACERLGREILETHEARYPRTWWRESGYIAVDNGDKRKLLAEVSKALREVRQSR